MDTPEGARGPRLVIDNEPLIRSLYERAQEELKSTNPLYTYDDLIAEVERMRSDDSRSNFSDASR